MAYIGNNLTVSQYAPQIAYFSGNGSTTAFTLPQSVVSSAQILVFVANVPQNPSSAYTVSGTTLTFTSAPPTGTNNVWVEYTSLQTNTVAPSVGSVNSNSFGSVTSIPFTGYNSIGTGNSSAMKNRIINGAMVIDQRNAGASVTPASSAYTLDRWQAAMSVASKYSVQQLSASAPAGFGNYLGVTSLSAYAVGTSDYFNINQSIEGFNIADLTWGTANAKTVTLSFQVYSSLTGTFGGTLRNSAGNYNYPFSYSIPTANTWTPISIVITGPTSGTWVTNNGIGVNVGFALGVGSTLSGTAGAWSTNNYLSATGATSVVGTSGATFYITGVQLEVGLAATGFEYRQYGTELALCQRYACSTFPIGTAWAQNSSANGGVMTFYAPVNGGIAPFFYPVQMRAAPTITFYNPSGANTNWYLNNAATESSGTYGISSTSVGTLITTVANASNQYARVHLSASAEL